MTAQLSRHCAQDQHGFCTLTSTDCGCTVCHFICAECGEPCRTRYDHDGVCATCYRTRVYARTRAGCEYPTCLQKRAYVDLRYASHGFLCIEHHLVMGHRVPGHERGRTI